MVCTKDNWHLDLSDMLFHSTTIITINFDEVYKNVFINVSLVTMYMLM